MEKLRGGVIAVLLVIGMALVAGCEKGPVQKAGERVDRATGQEPLIGKGPVEDVGKKMDKAVDELKK